MVKIKPIRYKTLQLKVWCNPVSVCVCVLQATSHPDPVEVYSRVHSCGVGMQMAALYVSWAQEFERKDLKAQAEQVYQKAFKNRAEPLDFLQHHYRSPKKTQHLFLSIMAVVS